MARVRFLAPGQAFEICVLGTDPFGQTLDATLAVGTMESADGVGLDAHENRRGIPALAMASRKLSGTPATSIWR